MTDDDKDDETQHTLLNNNATAGSDNDKSDDIQTNSATKYTI